MRILIAEDEKDLNKIISARLKAEHYSVDSCFDGEEALEYLRSAQYDAVVLDIMMPKKDGITVLRTIRREKNQTPVAASDCQGQRGGPGDRSGCRSE